jgi:rRNA pseudouridine-1189 N-methylase Emg1 (Nep1/Mra1 family)
MEQLLLNDRVPPQGDALLQIHNTTLEDLLTKLKSDSESATTILAVEGGQNATREKLGSLLPQESSVPVIVGVGAFPHGDMPEEIGSMFETHLELDREVMMAWHVCAEMLWAYSLSIDVFKDRY